MIKPMFVVTSAVESRFGMYSPQQRLDMTLATLECLYERVPNAKVVVSEVSGNGISEKFENALSDNCDLYLDFTTNAQVRGIYNEPRWYENWDVVKNLTELTTFPQALDVIQSSGELEGIDRVFKMSGRYLLNEKFDLSLYEQPDVADKVVIGRAVKSHFPYQVTLQEYQYMCRLLSWPAQDNANMIRYYLDGCNYMKDRLVAGGYADIEHCLYYSIPRDQVYEVDEVGVYGNIAPNGQPIVN